MASHQEITNHVHGEMDIRVHQKTFAGFIRLATWVCGISAAVLVFMALVNS
ncbi:aa3-type cytochrome c oxidase subunit IV [Paracoccus aminophilus]|uniref:Aa3 type cytochrome c oxidase, subunit IV n=1 Tax=Paracoccus aminophilus JCM 7686 TaxID=1367847 RepID=S5XJK8_PARAH|nr:aa3-type cytochrome c oxidase subunit IV [Paracoccus aminophilus]AGT07369.1 aa3 type cytochrome c oxidase, subunit IV [Paracoccus aminophilus JCM 7686]